MPFNSETLSIFGIERHSAYTAIAQEFDATNLSTSRLNKRLRYTISQAYSGVLGLSPTLSIARSNLCG